MFIILFSYYIKLFEKTHLIIPVNTERNLNKCLIFSVK